MAVKHRNINWITTFCLTLGCLLSGNASGENPTNVPETAGKISGIDKSLFSSSVDSSGDNFYLYANEKWLSETEIPSTSQTTVLHFSG